MSLDLSGHIEDQLANTYVRMEELDVRNQKSAYLPKLYGFFSHQQQTYGFEFDPGGNWYPATLWGYRCMCPSSAAACAPTG
jgi:hypothetical protein